MQVFLVLRLIILCVFVVFQGSVGVLAAMILFTKDNLIMGSQFAPVAIFELLVSLIAVIWVPAMIVVDMTTQLSRWSKIKYELCWLSGLSVALIAGATATTAVLPFPKFDQLSEELMWMGRWTSNGMFNLQVVGWTAVFILLSYLVSLLVLCLLHAESCPHLLDWPVKSFDWFPLPSRRAKARPMQTNATPATLESAAPQLGHVRNMSSISNLPLSLSAAPPAQGGRGDSPPPPAPPPAPASSSFAHARSQSKSLARTPPPAALNLGFGKIQQQTVTATGPTPAVVMTVTVADPAQAEKRALAGQSFFIQSPVTPEPARTTERTAKEKRNDLARNIQNGSRDVIAEARRAGSPESDKVRKIDPEHRRRYYGQAGWANDI